MAVRTAGRGACAAASKANLPRNRTGPPLLSRGASSRAPAPAILVRSSWNEHRGTIEAARAQIRQGPVGIAERVFHYLRLDADQGSRAQEIVPILPGEIGRRTADDARPRAGHTEYEGMSLMWMPAQTTRPPLRTADKAAGTSSPGVAKMIAASRASGGGSSDEPAHTAPSRRANAWLRRSPGRVKA